MIVIILIVGPVFLGGAMTCYMFWAEKHPGRVPIWIRKEVFRCPNCKAKLQFEEEKWKCIKCGNTGKLMQ